MILPWHGTGSLSNWQIKFTKQMQNLETAEADRPWRAKIYKDWRLGLLWCFHAFPEYTDGQMPPYPGFNILESWLSANFPQSVAYERRMLDGRSVLEITFNNEQDGMLFKLGATYK